MNHNYDKSVQLNTDFAVDMTVENVSLNYDFFNNHNNFDICIYLVQKTLFRALGRPKKRILSSLALIQTRGFPVTQKKYFLCNILEYIVKKYLLSLFSISILTQLKKTAYFICHN